MRKLFNTLEIITSFTTLGLSINFNVLLFLVGQTYVLLAGVLPIVVLQLGTLQPIARIRHICHYAGH
jgi:hypothetical protein